VYNVDTDGRECGIPYPKQARRKDEKSVMRKEKRKIGGGLDTKKKK
jgi:hypothetical protein